MITLWIKFCHSRLRHRDNIWETERVEAWQTRNTTAQAVPCDIQPTNPNDK